MKCRAATAAFMTAVQKWQREKTDGLEKARRTNENILDRRGRARRDFSNPSRILTDAGREEGRTSARGGWEISTPRAMPCTRNSSEALISLLTSPPPASPFPSRVRDAPHTSDFLTNPGNLAAPITPSPLVSTFIFLVFRAWIPAPWAARRLGSSARADL